MSETIMVEHVAFAINRAGISWLEENDPKRTQLTWADVPDEVFARAALAAMREPTRRMIDHANSVVLPDADNDQCPQFYREMIEFALNEDQTK